MESNNTVNNTLDHIAVLEQARSDIMAALAEKWQTILDYLQTSNADVPLPFDMPTNSIETVRAIQAEIDALNEEPILPPPAKRIRLSSQLANASEFEPSIEMNEDDEWRCIGSLLNDNS
jgi:hypothetical protein